MSITVTQHPQTPDAHKYGDPRVYDFKVDGTNIGKMTVGYPREPSVWLGKPSVISRLAFRDVPTKELVVLLSASETTIPDKRSIGVMLHANALDFVERITHDDALAKDADSFRKINLEMAAKTYGDVAKTIEQVKQRLSSGEQHYDDTIALLAEAGDSLKTLNHAVREKLGHDRYEYMRAELGRTPLQIAEKIDSISATLSAAEKILSGKSQELLPPRNELPGHLL